MSDERENLLADEEEQAEAGDIDVGGADLSVEGTSGAEPGSGPSAASGAEVPLLTNGQLANTIHEIGDLLEVKGELGFKTTAYHRAADAVGRHPTEVAQAYRDGTPPEIPGVGKSIAAQLEELALTGRSSYRDKLLAEFPTTLLEMLRLPGVGPKTVRLIYQELGVKTVDELKVAAETHRIRTLRGLSAKTELLILDGIEKLDRRDRRMLLGQAKVLVDELVRLLTPALGVGSITPAGSYRRRRETIGDLDLLAETDDPDGVIDTFAQLPSVERIIGQGGHKAAVRLGGRGPQVDLMVMRPEQAGTHLIHFTGSKEHNVRLREMARDLGWSLSEYGYARLDDDGQIITDVAKGGDLRTFATEAEAYAFLGLPFIPPELREDRGEIEAALAGTLPTLIEEADLKGDLHSHTDWSDGRQPMEVMAEFARRRGHEYQVLTDHSVSLVVASGLSPERVLQERAAIRALNARFEAEEAAGTAPPEASTNGFRLLHGCELEINPDGSLDYGDELLSTFDLVVASLHVARRQSRAELTQRTLNAIENPHVDVIAHPSGRKIDMRDDLDLDWDTVYRAAARTGTVLEMNGSPPRLDLSVERARRALEFGCILSIDSDAHTTSEFDHLAWGISQARRAWVTPDRVLNTRSRVQLMAWLATPKPRGPLPPLG
ncbi:MAG TPA: DNA polymerase/3'-5' exonuclease PolX [Candidatus Limnocylindrales bacterium]|nr:DNA polymerase/3'-5' exonuclease PolX [Candidatus Limnocylindrales bacterium]